MERSPWAPPVVCGPRPLVPVCVLSWERPCHPACPPLPLGQWISTRGDSATRGRLAMSGDAFSWRWGAAVTCWTPQCIRQSPQQSITWSKEATTFRNLKASYKWIWTTTNICGVTFEILKEYEYLNLQGTQCMSCRLVTVHVLVPLLQCKLWRRGSRYLLLNPQP